MCLIPDPGKTSIIHSQIQVIRGNKIDDLEVYKCV